MAAKAKAYNANLITSGPGDLWIDTVNPAAGELIDIDLTAGTPDGTTHAAAKHLGLTREGITVSLNAEIETNEADELTDPYSARITNSEARMEGEWLQVLDMALVAALALGATYDSESGFEFVTFGGKTDPTYHQATLIWKTKYNKFAVAHFYRAFNEGGFSAQISRINGDAGAPLNLRGLSDSSRASGDQVCQIWRESIT